MNNNLFVTKRNGEKETIDLEKIAKRFRKESVSAEKNGRLKKKFASKKGRRKKKRIL